MVVVSSFLLRTRFLPLKYIDTDTTIRIEIVWTHLNAGKNSDIIAGSFYCLPHSPDTTLAILTSLAI